MVLGGEVFIYKLLFQKACNDYSEKSVEELRKKLRGDDEVDFIEDLLEYLDEQLPKADDEETEEILERAAPILAALLVPMKKKYDEFIEIKDEVTETVLEIVPVEEIISDYEETLQDLNVFCDHLKKEVGTSLEDNIEELHRKLWELESNHSESEYSIASLDSPYSNQLNGFNRTRMLNRSPSLQMEPPFTAGTKYLVPGPGDRDYFRESPIEINLEGDSEETPAPDNNTNFTFLVEGDGSECGEAPPLQQQQQLCPCEDSRRLNLSVLKQRFENVFVSFDAASSSPELLVTEEEHDKRSGSVDSNPDLSPFSLYEQFPSTDIVINETLAIQPNITVIGVTPRTSRAASRAESPISSFPERSYSIVSASDTGLQSPRLGYYSAIPSRRQSLSNDIILRYLSAKDPSQGEPKRLSIPSPATMDYLSSGSFYSTQASRRSSFYDDTTSSSPLDHPIKLPVKQLDTLKLDRRPSDFVYHDIIIQNLSRRSSLGARSPVSAFDTSSIADRVQSRRSMLAFLIDYVRYQINRDVSTDIPVN